MTGSTSGARVGLLLIVAATVLAILFGREHALSLGSAGRLFIVGALAVLADRGRRWAAVTLGVLVLAAAVGLIIGSVRVGPSSRWGILFALDALLFVFGLAWFVLAARRGAARPPKAGESPG